MAETERETNFVFHGKPYPTCVVHDAPAIAVAEADGQQLGRYPGPGWDCYWRLWTAREFRIANEAEDLERMIRLEEDNPPCRFV